MRRVVVGVIGHVDHGKSALVRALTGQDTDRLPEEKERGISIALGFAHLKVAADTEIDLIDMPGHERFVRTMIAGATGIDAVLLVVAANEGIKPQTIEHVDVAALLGLKRAVVAISKADLVAADESRRVADTTVNLLAQSGFEVLPPIMTSALQESGIADLRATLASLAVSHHPRSTDGLAFLPIDRAFSIAGHGPVVTGTLRGAALSAGDTLELFPSRRTVRIRAVQVHGSRVESALPGQRVALNLRDVVAADLHRGMALAAPDALEPSEWLTISIRAVSNAPALQNGVRLRALLGTDELEARVRLLDREVLAPGEHGFAQLRCAHPVAIPAREHAILRLPSPALTVAGGKVLEPAARRLRRRCPETLQRLEDLRALPPDAAIAAEIYRAGAMGIALRALSRASALAVPRITALLPALPVVITRSGVVVRKTDMEQLLSRIPPLLAAHARGLSREQVFAALSGTSLTVLDEALAMLAARDVISERGGQFLLPQPEEDRAHARNEAALAAEIAALLRSAGLTPPNPSTIVTGAPAKRAVDRLLREHIIVRAVDRTKGRELLFHRDAIEAAQQRLAPLIEQPPGLLVSEIAAALGISRKFTMPLLSHLDAIRFTLRIGDRRLRGGTAARRQIVG